MHANTRGRGGGDEGAHVHAQHTEHRKQSASAIHF